VRVALWLCGDIATVEAGMTQLCAPLWSRCRGEGSWAWREPDHIVAPEYFDPQQSSCSMQQRSSGVYAWVYLPKMTGTLRAVMVDGAAGRIDRRVAAPAPWRCPTPGRHLPCSYTRLVEPMNDTLCPRCGLSRRVAEHLAAEAGNRALDRFEALMKGRT